MNWRMQIVLARARCGLWVLFPSHCFRVPLVVGRGIVILINLPQILKRLPKLLFLLFCSGDIWHEAFNNMCTPHSCSRVCCPPLFLPRGRSLTVSSWTFFLVIAWNVRCYVAVNASQCINLRLLSWAQPCSCSLETHFNLTSWLSAAN